MSKKSLLNITILAIALGALSFGFYKNYKSKPLRYLPYYGNREIDNVTKDTIFHAVANFKFTDQQGNEVTENGNLYKAMWGGTEVPGANTCRTEAECRHNGWQWMLVGECKASYQNVSCHEKNAWSSDIANGRVAPWTYAGGQEVTNNGNLFRAMWGGTEVPGEKICSTEADCRNKGWQWMIVGTCSQEEPVNSICNGKNEWSVDIANGRKAPWTYLGGAQVTHNGALYKAMWGGSEVPGTHVCRTDGECRNNGWQWMTEGQC